MGDVGLVIGHGGERGVRGDRGVDRGRDLLRIERRKVGRVERHARCECAVRKHAAVRVCSCPHGVGHRSDDGCA